MAVIRLVMRRVGVRSVERNRALGAVEMAIVMVFDEVPEDAERLQRDQQGDRDNREECRPMQDGSTGHGAQSTIARVRP